MTHMNNIILMEILKMKPIKQMFKFSTIWNILPFYGKLHKWRWMMKILWKQTSQIWNDNEDAFVRCGSDLKVPKAFNSCRFMKSDIIKVIKWHKVYSHYLFKGNINYREKKNILSLLKKGFTISLERSYYRNCKYIKMNFTNNNIIF